MKNLVLIICLSFFAFSNSKAAPALTGVKEQFLKAQKENKKIFLGIDQVDKNIKSKRGKVRVLVGLQRLSLSNENNLDKSIASLNEQISQVENDSSLTELKKTQLVKRLNGVKNAFIEESLRSIKLKRQIESLIKTNS